MKATFEERVKIFSTRLAQLEGICGIRICEEDLIGDSLPIEDGGDAHEWSIDGNAGMGELEGTEYCWIVRGKENDEK